MCKLKHIYRRLLNANYQTHFVVNFDGFTFHKRKLHSRCYTYFQARPQAKPIAISTCFYFLLQHHNKKLQVYVCSRQISGPEPPSTPTPAGARRATDQNRIFMIFPDSRPTHMRPVLFTWRRSSFPIFTYLV